MARVQSNTNEKQEAFGGTIHSSIPQSTFSASTSMKRNIKKVAILGSGVMGSRIACHFANIGISALLLDIVPRDLTESEKAAGVSKESTAFKNRIVNDSLNGVIKSSPSPLYEKEFSKRITVGNFDDDLAKIKDCDLVLEAIIEDLEIKKQMFDKIEKLRKPGSLIASNTSGIPLTMMSEGRTEDFQKHFFGMHFFNPPRYLRLLEIIPTQYTDPEIVNFMMYFGDLRLGKQMVLCKDTPAFIANRVGLFALMKVLEVAEELDLTIEEVDKLTGSATGKPNTGTFRLCDLIGIDTALKVKKGLHQNLPKDEYNSLFGKKSCLEAVVEKGWYGDKSGQGFYKKSKDAEGNRIIMGLDLHTMEYRPSPKVKIPSLDQTKPMDNLSDRLKIFYNVADKGGELFRKTSLPLFAYVSNRIPEISDDIFRIDDGLKTGFGWDIGPFETWDILGVKKAYEAGKKAGLVFANWIEEFLAAGNETFYTYENGKRLYYDIPSKSYQVIPGTESLIMLDAIRKTKVVWKNSGCSLFDLGDGVMGVEFHTKMNAIGGEVVEGINKAIDRAEKEGWQGIVIGNQATNFSAGANLAMILMMGFEQEFDEIDFAVRAFQNTNMRVRYSSIPVVVAPHGLTLGGGCEMTMHADHVVAAAETYIGLVEVGVGLIPGGGGSKEMVLRLSDSYKEGDVELNDMRNAFLTIGQAKVATSAHEAIGLNLLRASDTITMNKARQLKDAKTEVLRLASEGYQMPIQRKDVRVTGRTGLGLAYAGLGSMQAAGYITEYDAFIARKLAWILCGGDLTGTQFVSEQYLLDLEREAFLSLMGEKRTLDRIQTMLKTGKPLRN